MTADFRLYDYAVSATVPVATLNAHVWPDAHLLVEGNGTLQLILTVQTLDALFPFLTGNDTVDTGAGDDVLYDYGGDLVASLGGGSDTVQLYEAAGASTNKVVDLGSGDDEVFYQGGNGTILAGLGNDFIGVNGGNDGTWLLIGGDGQDTIYASADSII